MWLNVLLGLVALTIVSAIIGGKGGIWTLFTILSILIADAVVSAAVGFGTAFVIDVNSLHGHYPVQFMTSMAYLISGVCFICAGAFFIGMIVCESKILVMKILVISSLILTIGGISAIVKAFAVQNVVSGISTGYKIVGIGFIAFLILGGIGWIISYVYEKRRKQRMEGCWSEEDAEEREEIKREQKEDSERAKREKKEADERAERGRKDDVSRLVGTKRVLTERERKDIERAERERKEDDRIKRERKKNPRRVLRELIKEMGG